MPALAQPIPFPGKPLIKLPVIDSSRLNKVQANDQQSDIAALKKKNDELQAQIEALKKKQQPSAAQASQSAGKAQPPARSSDIAIGSKNTEAAAKTLKEAIEAMNADSGELPKKAAK